jgi:4-hydroxy-tetrahydrodipicolinate reductase
MIRLAVAGAAGRMGRCVLDMAVRDERFSIAAALTIPNDPALGTPLHLSQSSVVLVDRLDTPCDVLIDFTVQGGTRVWLEECRRRGIPMVIGATGQDAETLSRIREAAREIPIVKAGNFSRGIQAVLRIAAALARQLGPEYDIEIVETHHRHKLDAPSGTALAIFDEIAAACEWLQGDDVVHGRSGRLPERPKTQVGIHSVRMGEIIGQHEIHWSGPGESITVRHVAHSRDAFAAGALRAAAWLVTRPPGLYGMNDVENQGEGVVKETAL